MKQSKFEYGNSDNTGYVQPVIYSRHEVKTNKYTILSAVMFGVLVLLVWFGYSYIPEFQYIVNLGDSTCQDTGIVLKYQVIIRILSY